MEELYYKTFELILALLLGLVGFYFAHNYRRHVKLKTTEGRLAAYARLWQITAIATPMRKHNWHEGEAKDSLSLEERIKLYKELTEWYYKDGNGMFLGESTRRIYLGAKQNLICPDDELEPKDLCHSLKNLPTDIYLQKRGDLSIRQLSLLRARMRSDLEVYGPTFFGELHPNDILFLRHCKVKLWKKPWAGARKRKQIKST